MTLATSQPSGLPVTGQRVAVAGCSTSWFIARSYAALREKSGQGLTGAFVTSPNRVAWMFGKPDGLRADVARTGGLFVTSDPDPLADLIRVQSLAVAVAERRGADPDSPRHLARPVILSGI